MSLLICKEKELFSEKCETILLTINILCLVPNKGSVLRPH